MGREDLESETSYSDDEINHIKEESWDSGWRWGILFGITICVLLLIIVLTFKSKFNY